MIESMNTSAEIAQKEEIRGAWVELQTALDWLRRDRPDQADACMEAAMERLEKLLGVRPEHRLPALRR